jgi:hypothetical protein
VLFRKRAFKSATAADSMHSTRMDTGMARKIRLRAMATIVQENKVGKVGAQIFLDESNKQ